MVSIFSTSSIVESQEGCVIWLISGGDLKEVDKGLSLSGERVDDVLLVVGDWSLEEEVQVGENWAHGLVVNLHSGEELTKNNHVDHEWGGKEGIFANIVGVDGANTVHEDHGGVLVEGSLGVLHEWDVLDDNLVVDVVVTFWIKDLVAFDSIIKNSTLGNLLGLEALVFLEVLSVVVTQMVVGDN